MRILICSIDGPEPRTNGIRLAVGALLDELRKRHEIRYIGYRMQKQPGYESDLFRLAVYDRKSGQSRVLTESFRNWIDEFDWSSDSKTLFFAGEATHSTDFSTAHGAHDSGDRAAEEAIAVLMKQRIQDA